MSIELMTLSSHLVLCHPLLLLSIFPSIKVFSNEPLPIRWPMYWSFSRKGAERKDIEESIYRKIRWYHGRSHNVSSVQSLSRVRLFATPWTAACRASLSSPTPRAYSNSCLSNRWCHPTISSSVVPFSSCLQSSPASGSFLMSPFIRWPKYWSFNFSISPSNKYSGLIPLGLTSWSPCSPRDSQESSPTPQFKRKKHQFFSAQLSL